jgi:hypothetical protein
MPVRYDIFECDEVQFQTRRRVRRLVGVVLAAAVLTMGLATVLYRREMVPAWLLGGGLLLAWKGVAVGAIVRWRRLRRAAWCLKASRVDLVGYDYARRRCSLTHLGRDPPRGTGRRRSAH